MTGAAPHSTEHRRLEQLYEISKLFAAFEGVEHSVDAALKVIAGTLPLESAVVIEAVIGGHTDLIVWGSEGDTPARLGAAKAHAIDAYAYLMGARSFGAIDLRDDLRESAGRSTLPAPPRRPDAALDPHRFLVIPLVVGRGVVFGALQVEGAARLTRSDLEFVNAIANQLAIALDRSRAWSYDVLRRQEAQRLQVKYETLVDHLDYAFVWEAEAETRRMSYVSAQVERMLGFSPHQCTADPMWWSTQVHPEDREQLEHTFARALAEPGNKRCEHRCIAADGSLRWLRTSIHLVGAGGEPPHLQGVSFDVTAARVAQEQVREQLSLTAAMASSVAEGTLAIDLEDRVTFLNDAGAHLLGCSGRPLGQRSAGIVHVETADGAIVESPLAAAIRGGPVRSDRHVFVRADRRRFPASYTATPIRRDGRVTGAMLAFDDITARVSAQRAEHFLVHAGVVLSASLESSAVASAAAGLGVPVLGDVCFIAVTSTDDRLVHVASAHRDAAAQRALVDALGPEPRDPVFDGLVREVVATGRSIQVAITAGPDHLAAEPPAVRALELRGVLIVPLAVGGRRLGALSFGVTGDRAHGDRDVALAEELGRRSAQAIEHARLYEQARHAVALREQTLAIVSHDLRTPLATILMASSMLGDDARTVMPPRSRELAIDKLQHAAERMNRMIDDLLDFASIEIGQLSIHPGRRDVAALVEESLAGFEAVAASHQVALVRDVAAGLPAIQCDSDRILQVLANLLGNAFKVVPAGGSVRVTAQLVDRDVVLSVRDTGPGIALADQPRLFERYWRSPDAGYKGTGLGLAIARGLVEAHRGTIWVDSVPGHGATFSFTLPVADPALPRVA